MNWRPGKNLTMAGLVSLGILCGATAQQDKPSAPTEAQQSLRVSTHMVLVPVVVTDKHGDHVTGLTAADFEVKEEGSAQKIVRIDEFTAEASKVPVPTANAKTFTNEVVSEHPKKLAIIVLDQVNTPFASARDGSRHLIEFLSHNMDANTLLALVAIQHNGIRVLHNFSSDPSILVAAVKKVEWSLSSRDARSSDNPGDSSEADQEATQLTALLNAADVGSATSAAEAVKAARATSARQRAQVDAARQAQDGLITLEDFQQIAQYFGGVPGRKSLIWASVGFPFALGAIPQANTRGPLTDDWERTFRMLADANISVYPVDIGGLLPGIGANTLQNIDSNAVRANGPDGGVGMRTGQLEAIGNGAFLDPNNARQQTMRQVADMTGGQAFYNSNDGGELFRRAANDAAQYYVLGYYTRDSGRSGWRKLSVKVARDGAKVRARSGFFFNANGTEPEAARQAEEMLAMSSDLNFTTLPVRGTWQQIEPVGNERKVRFLLSVPPGVPMIDTENKNLLNFDFRVLVTDTKGQVAGKIGQRLQTNLAADEAEKIRTVGLDYMNELTLAPGEYKVHFVIRDNLRGTLGSVVATLQLD